MAESLLTGFKVLELPGLGGACGRFLAALGADVVKLEPPGGEPARRLADGRPDPAWIARNLGKRSVCADLATPAGRALALELTGAADFLIESLPADEAQRLGLDPAAVAALNPRLVHVSITPFGRSGPYADFAGGELVVSAMGGALWGVGYPDRAPVKEALDACTFHAAAAAAAGALFAHRERGISGLGQHVDVSAQQVAASRGTSGLLAWQFDRRVLRRTGVNVSYGTAQVRYVWELKDGYCFHGLMSGKIGAPANAALSRWMDEEGFDNPMREVEWERYDRGALPADVRLVWEAAIDTFFRAHTRAEIAGEGRRRGINATVANEPGDVLADPHLAARAFFDTVAGLEAPSRFVRLVDREPAPAAPAPETGEHGDAVRRDWLAAPASPAVLRSSDASAEPPLKGVKVLDFSWALVGSITTKSLADFGAEVVKVESASRPCLSRIDVQVAASKRGNFDDKPWFIHLNTSKKSLRLNVKREGWRRIIDPLLDWADVVVENFSPGTMKSLGLDYETLKVRRPDLIMVSGSVFGQTGPLAREWGVDGTGAALSGRLFLTGWPDRAPMNPSSAPFGDVILPPLMAAAAAAALDHRRRTGEGQHIDASMYEACVQQMAGSLIQTQIDGAPRRRGNRDAAVLHQAVLPALGEDRWIAVTVPDAAAWGRLTLLVGGGDWPSAAEVLAAGDAALDALDARLAAWTSGADRYALMQALQAAGVPAGVVQDPSDLLERDPQLRGRTFLEVLDNPVLGAFGHQATPYVLSRTPARMTTAPNLGQHSEWVARELACLSQDAFQHLEQSGLFE